jgi:hypothetical protein
MLSEPEDEEDSGIIVERPETRTSARKKIFQTVDDFIGVGRSVPHKCYFINKVKSDEAISHLS